MLLSIFQTTVKTIYTLENFIRHRHRALAIPPVRLGTMGMSYGISRYAHKLHLQSGCPDLRCGLHHKVAGADGGSLGGQFCHGRPWYADAWL